MSENDQERDAIERLTGIGGEPECCGNCHFARFAIVGGQIDLKQLQCKRDTIKVYQQITPTGMQFVTMRPPTTRNEWCGEWKPKR